MILGGIPTIYVSNMDQAVEFYSVKLGLKVRDHYGDKWASIDAGNGLLLGLHPASKNAPAPGSRGATSVGLNVTEPLEKVMSTLQSRGVKFNGPIQSDAEGGIKLAFFEDPDGNGLYLFELMRTW
jgi:catechol 2,3-dioxygenase-like lactoylglutathione lyase family enzyme